MMFKPRRIFSDVVLSRSEPGRECRNVLLKSVRYGRKQARPGLTTSQPAKIALEFVPVRQCMLKLLPWRLACSRLGSGWSMFVR